MCLLSFVKFYQSFESADSESWLLITVPWEALKTVPAQSLSLEVHSQLVWGGAQALIFYLCECVCVRVYEGVCDLNMQPGLTFRLKNESY